jgi:hypothetical protein
MRREWDCAKSIAGVREESINRTDFRWGEYTCGRNEIGSRKGMERAKIRRGC